MPLNPEKRAAILADHRKGSSPSVLATSHKVARSTIYRLLQSVAETESTESVANIDENVVVNGISKDFYATSEKFAKDMGLEEDDENEEKVKKSPQEAEDDAEKAMAAVFGTEPVPGMRVPISRVQPVQVERDDESVVEPPAAPRPTLQRSVSRDEVVQRIAFNVEHFGPILSQFTGPDKTAFLQSLATKGDAELANLLNAIECNRSVANLSTAFKHAFFAVAQGTEMMTSKFLGMNTTGFCDNLKAQEADITMAMKECAMDRWRQMKALDKPEWRLGILFCLTLVQTDANNRMKDLLAKQAPEPKQYESL